MHKHIKIFLSLLTAVLLTGCSDDFHWDGRTVADDEYMIVFTTSGPQLDVMQGTRADDGRKSDSERDAIQNMTLLVFNNEGLAKDPIYFNAGDNNLVDNGTSGSITVKKKLVTDGEWLLVANAKTEIAAEFAKHGLKYSKDNFLEDIKYGGEAVSGVIKGDDQLNGQSSHVMWASHQVEVGESETQVTAHIFDLQRIYSRVSVELKTKATQKFLMTGAKLSRRVEVGNLSASQSSSVTEGDVSSDGFSRPPVGLTNTSPSFTYAKADEQILTETYPYTVPADAANDGKILMIIEGYYNNGTTAAPVYGERCYYAVELPELLANHHYQMIVSDVATEGKTGSDAIKQAEANPGGMSVDFVDNTEQLRNIITDGENVLAVNDTVRFDASGAGRNQNLIIKARQKGASANDIKISINKKTGQDALGWDVQGLSNVTTQSLTTAGTEEAKNGLFSVKKTYGLSVPENAGSEREIIYVVSLLDKDGETLLEREVVFYQKGNENVKYSDYVAINLKIERGTNVEYNGDYFAFINPKLKGDGTTDPAVKGIQPEANVGRIRNMGLHYPMPNGGNVKYTYKITRKTTDVTIDGDVSATYTVTDAQSTFAGDSKYSYGTKSDAVKIKYSGGEITLDLYHTGFFYMHGTSWYYYEVIQQGEDDLYWLDRNLKAESCGMGVLNGSTYLTSSSQPVVGDKAVGERYNMTDANSDCPAGWGVPSYAQMRSMTVSSGFTTRRLTTSNQIPYYAPTYTFSGKEDGVTKQYNIYFPANRMLYSGSVDGDDDTGYYLTTTGAGTANWYKTMVFQGMNVSAANVNYNNAKTSVRPCAGDYDPSADALTYSCSVEGYTHVFLYYQDPVSKQKTYLTTWPGEQVAVYSDRNRYHPFSISPTMAYDIDNLYVIFNLIIDDGSREDSNVSEDKVELREGIKFKNKGKYTSKSPHDTSTGADQGHWDGSLGGNDDEEFRLKGNFNGLNWREPNNNSSYQFTSKGSGKYELSVTVSSAGKFVIAQKVSGWTTNAYKEWKHNQETTNGTDVANGGTYTMYEGKGNNCDWRFPSAGTYTLTIDWPNKTFTVSTSGGGTSTDVIYRIYWPYDGSYFMGLDLFGDGWYSSVFKYQSADFNQSKEISVTGFNGIKDVKYNRYGTTPYAYMEFKHEGGNITGSMKYKQITSSNGEVNETSIDISKFTNVNGVLCYNIGAKSGGTPGNADTWPIDKPYRMYWDWESSTHIWIWTDTESGDTFNGGSFGSCYGTSVGNNKYYREYTLSQLTTIINAKLNNSNEYSLTYSNDNNRLCLSDKGTYYELRINY